jgi:outer membrane biosynthesis protein TonB
MKAEEHEEENIEQKIKKNKEENEEKNKKNKQKHEEKNEDELTTIEGEQNSRASCMYLVLSIRFSFWLNKFQLKKRLSFSLRH